jgi:hypothetical protein
MKEVTDVAVLDVSVSKEMELRRVGFEYVETIVLIP